MKLIIITGQLGAGKTTILNSLIETISSKDYGIIINEYSASGIDSDFLGKKGVNELNDGCVCCSKGEDLKDLLISMKNKEYVLLETTGLSDLNQLISRLGEYGIEIANIVLVIDGKRIENSELSKNTINQIKISPTIVLSKSDLIKNAKEYESLIKKINPGSDVFKTSLKKKLTFKDVNKDYKIYKKNELSVFKKYLYKLIPELKLSKESRHINRQGIKSLAFNLGIIDFKKFEDLLKKNKDLVRAKGFIKTDKGDYKFNYTYGLYSIQKNAKKLNTSKLVFIGKFRLFSKIKLYLKVYDLEKKINTSKVSVVLKALTNR